MLILPLGTCGSILESKPGSTNHEPRSADMDGNFKKLRDLLSPYDMKRLEAYTSNRADYHTVSCAKRLIMDPLSFLLMSMHSFFSELRGS